MNTFIHQGHAQLFQMTVKTFIILSKYCTFELSIHQRILKKWITVSLKNV